MPGKRNKNVPVGENEKMIPNKIIICEINYLSKGIKIIFEDGSSLLINEDIFSNHFLYKNKVMSSDEYEIIKEESDLMEAYDYCTKIISKKMYSIKHIKERLINIKHLSTRQINFIINRLIENHFLDDKEYALTLVDSLERKGYGFYKIENDLLSKGINKDIYVYQYNQEKELERGRAILNDLINKFKNYNSNKMINSIYNSLELKGYKEETCALLIEEINLNNYIEQDYLKLKADYDKIIMHFKRGMTILDKQKIVNKLLKKGYQYRDIKKIMEDVDCYE